MNRQPLGAPIVLLCAAVLTLLPLASAQITTTHVVPQAYVNVEANSLDQEPFGMDQMRSLHYIDRSLLTGIPTNTLIRQIAYRRDGGLTMPSMTRTRVTPPIWQVRLGNFTANYLTVSGTFPAAAAAGYTIVFSAKQFSFPSLPLINGGGPQNFDLKFPLDVVWPYPGNGIAIDHYCYETVNVNNNYQYFVDAIAPAGAGGSAGLISPTSLGCPAGQNRAYGQSTNPGVGDLVLSLFGAESTKVAYASLGTSTTAWGSLVLPFDLAVIGLAGCKVYTDYAVQAPTLTTVSGTAEYRIAVPANASVAGAMVYGQWLVQDSRVNPTVNLATSDGLKYVIGTQLPSAMSTVNGSGMFANGGTGYVQVNRGYVVQFGW